MLRDSIAYEGVFVQQALQPVNFVQLVNIDNQFSVLNLMD